MASGTIYGPVIGGGYRLEIDWSESNVDTANNNSDVTAKVYWHSLGSAYTISSSAQKSGSTDIKNGHKSWAVDGAHLSGNQRRLLDTYTHTVNHNADGTAQITISSTFDCAVTLSGTYYSSTTASGTVTLDKIDRGRVYIGDNGAERVGQVFYGANGTRRAIGIWIGKNGNQRSIV